MSGTISRRFDSHGFILVAGREYLFLRSDSNDDLPAGTPVTFDYEGTGARVVAGSVRREEAAPGAAA